MQIYAYLAPPIPVTTRWTAATILRIDTISGETNGGHKMSTLEIRIDAKCHVKKGAESNDDIHTGNDEQ